jgi:hypothetical protein
MRNLLLKFLSVRSDLIFGEVGIETKGEKLTCGVLTGLRRLN